MAYRRSAGRKVFVKDEGSMRRHKKAGDDRPSDAFESLARQLHVYVAEDRIQPHGIAGERVLDMQMDVRPVGVARVSTVAQQLTSFDTSPFFDRHALALEVS